MDAKEEILEAIRKADLKRINARINLRLAIVEHEELLAALKEVCSASEDTGGGTNRE